MSGNTIDTTSISTTDLEQGNQQGWLNWLNSLNRDTWYQTSAGNWIQVTSDGFVKVAGESEHSPDAGASDAAGPDAGSPDAGTVVKIPFDPTSTCGQITKLLNQDPNATPARPPEGMADNDPRWIKFNQDLEEFGKASLDAAAADQLRALGDQLRADAQEIATFCQSQIEQQLAGQNANANTNNTGGNPAGDGNDSSNVGFGGPSEE